MLMIGTTIPAGLLLFTDEVKTLMQYIRDFGCPIDIFLIMVILQLPEIIVRCLPAGVLIGTMLVLHRMLRDYELVALQTSGVSTTRIFLPFIIIALFASAISFAINDLVVPDCLKSSMNLTLVAAARRDIPTSHGIKDFKGLQYGEDGKLKTIFLVHSRQGTKLTNTVLFDVRDPKNIRITLAPEGEFKNDSWYLRKGHIYNLVENIEQAKQNTYFQEMVIRPPDRGKFLPENRDPFPFELSSTQLMKRIDMLKSQNKEVSAELYLELYRKYADPLACLLITFAAFPVTLLGRRRRTVAGIAYGGVLLVSFFTLRSASAALSTNGLLAPLIAAWLPGLSLIISGSVMFYLAGRR